METHWQLTDPEFEAQFVACTLRPQLFTHEAHLRLAWWHLTQYGCSQTVVLLPRQLQHYVAHWGATDKYHATLTVAAIYVVEHFRQRSHQNTFKGFLEEFPRLRTHFKELLAQHYGPNILGST